MEQDIEVDAKGLKKARVSVFVSGTRITLRVDDRSNPDLVIEVRLKREYVAMLVCACDVAPLKLKKVTEHIQGEMKKTTLPPPPSEN